jgi:hypothetical protein
VEKKHDPRRDLGAPQRAPQRDLRARQRDALRPVPPVRRRDALRRVPPVRQRDALQRVPVRVPAYAPACGLAWRASVGAVVDRSVLAAGAWW